MNRIIIGALATTLLASPLAAQDLRPLENYSVHLGSVDGSVFYESADGTAHLVATLSSGPDATPIRVTTTLASGQAAVVSVPRGVGESALEVTFRRSGDHVVVEELHELAMGVALVQKQRQPALECQLDLGGKPALLHRARRKVAVEVEATLADRHHRG